jgi:alternate signal-mediated exported protein
MKRKILFAAVAVTLISLMVVGGTLAWFTDEQEAVNIVTTGSVEITLHDFNRDIVEGQPINDFAAVSGIVPGEVVPKFVTVKNTGNNNAFVRVQIVPVWYKTVENEQVELTPEERETAGIDDGSIALTVNGTSWTERDSDGYYCYMGILTPDEVAPTLLSAVTFDPDLGNAVQNLVVKIEVRAEAIQSDNMGSATYETVWVG